MASKNKNNNNASVTQSVTDIRKLAKRSNKPLAIIVAGHNGSGKSTMWYDHLADDLQIPLVNADRMMLSILPQPENGFLRGWAQHLRDTDETWMAVAQKGVESFVAQAMAMKVPFAVETVFSYWAPLPNGKFASKITLITDLQKAGYFVLLLFVGLADKGLSIGRVKTRRAQGGHDVDFNKLLERFPRTQTAIRHALPVADAAVLVDNSRDPARAFTPCYVRAGFDVRYDIRMDGTPAAEIAAWLNVVAPIGIMKRSRLRKANSTVAPMTVPRMVGLEVTGELLPRAVVGVGYITGGHMPEGIIGYQVPARRWPEVRKYLEKAMRPYKLHIPSNTNEPGREFVCQGANW